MSECGTNNVSSYCKYFWYFHPEPGKPGFKPSNFGSLVECSTNCVNSKSSCWHYLSFPCSANSCWIQTLWLRIIHQLFYPLIAMVSQSSCWHYLSLSCNVSRCLIQTLKLGIITHCSTKFPIANTTAGIICHFLSVLTAAGFNPRT